MKRICTVLIFVTLLFIGNTHKTNAQSSDDYFVGTWKVVVKATPNGDSPMTLSLVRKEGHLQGEIKFEGVEEPSVFSKVNEDENSITLYFVATGYDVNLRLEKKDENHVKGNMMDMFVAEGERVAED